MMMATIMNVTASLRERLSTNLQAKSKLAIIALFVAFMALSLDVMASGLMNKPVRSLSFYNTHTAERLETVYWANGTYIQSSLQDIDNHLRDHRSGTNTNMDTAVLNYMHDVTRILARRYPQIEMRVHVISGYRSPQTNAMLRASGGGQGKKSRHIHGDAIDFRIPGIPTAEIRDVAWCLQRGGVGYYRSSDFVHIDTHTVRHWNWSPTSKICN